MPTITQLEANHDLIPLTPALEDSMQGVMTGFEIVIPRVTDGHGAHHVTVHLLAACPNRSFTEAHGFGLENYIETPLDIREGRATAPETPGHGIVFDWDKLERLRT